MVIDLIIKAWIYIYEASIKWIIPNNQISRKLLINIMHNKIQKMKW